MSAKTNKLDSKSFNSNYKVLKETADWLAKQEEPDIDALVPRVELAMQAYQNCKNRLDQVKIALDRLLPPEEEPTSLAQNDDTSA